jgi:hypothetical protein
MNEAEEAAAAAAEAKTAVEAKTAEGQGGSGCQYDSKGQNIMVATERVRRYELIVSFYKSYELLK